MTHRLPGGWPCAACARGLLTAWAIVAWTGLAQAQQYVPQDETSFSDEEMPSHSGYSGRSALPAWQSDFDACGQGDCGGSCCDCLGTDPDCPCGEYAGGEQWWFTAEYLLWKTDSTHLPALVTDSPIGTVPALGSSSTQVLSAGKVAESWRSGYRLELGIWLDDCNSLALVGDYFNIGYDDYDYFFPGDSGRNTGRPYFNTQFGVQDILPISGTYINPDPPDPMFPFIVRDGTISVTADDEFQGTGVTLEQCIYAVGDSTGRGPSTQVVLLGGYRFFGYDSRLAIASTSAILQGEGAGSFESRRDVFTSDNEFHGGEIGAKVRFTQTACWFDGMFKLALGGHYRKVTINGATASIPAGGPLQLSEGGLYTSEDTNIGTYSDSRARLIPEFRIGVGVYLTPNWTLRAGYSAIVWSGVARAADGLPPNLAVDRRNVPGGNGNGGVSPVFSGLGGSELVANGLDLGFEYNY